MADTQPRNEVSAQADLSLVYRKDYVPSAFLIEKTHLDFQLLDNKVTVSSRLSIVRNTASSFSQAEDLILDGESLKLISVDLNQRRLSEEEYLLKKSKLIIKQVPDRFELDVVVEIDPASNLSLEGLYLSDGSYCTQCEAEGFRRITYYLDRPDVMSSFTTRIEADKNKYPQLLSNGNKIDSGDLGDGRHWVLWEDPHKKPCYLFALVAAKLAILEDHITTMSGREVTLQIYADEKDLDKCHHAMRSLKNAMLWDEKTYGREYDLDLYMIVAVSFFNMGAMENKGLNIFNTSCVLAHPLTQSDAAFQRVEAVVAHEYFHNWSGNRVTCRDWFQLSLKEGFTVYRDACFSADLNSATVKRIEDVQFLRSAQFAEDAGPMAHPIRPDSYSEISNFYTLTIYEKGAEVIRMQNQLLGNEQFRAGTDLYFERHDGQAVTCEDFILALEHASGYDLQQFRHWYEQAGTPKLKVTEDWDSEQGVYSLTVVQSCEATPGQPDKPNFHIPLAVGFVCDGAFLEEFAQILDIKKATQRWEFRGFTGKPVPSLLRGFSAPVKLEFDYSAQDLLALIIHEVDGFSRWDAAQRYYGILLASHLSGEQLIDSSESQLMVKGLCDCFIKLLGAGWSEAQGYAEWDNDILDAAMLAEIIAIPSYGALLEPLVEIPVNPLIAFRESLQQQVAKLLKPSMMQTYVRIQKQLQRAGEYQPNANHIALRSLKNLALSYIVQLPEQLDLVALKEQFHNANNMTDQFAALASVIHSLNDECQDLAEELLAAFIDQWQGEDLVVNQWLTANASRSVEGALEKVQSLVEHKLYDKQNPNKIRALVGALCNANFPEFHREDGLAYQFLADEVLRIDQFNAQVAARMVTPLTHWKRYTQPQRSLIKSALERIESHKLSGDLNEIVHKGLL